MARNKKKSLRVQKPFPLLKLPAEIRIHIWRFVVVNDVMVLVRNHGRNGRWRLRSKVDQQQRSSWLAVASTCRQLYLESTPIYYGENIFRPYGNDYETFDEFTDAIGPMATSTITEIGLYETCVPIDRYLAKLPGLKRLHSIPYGKMGWQNRLTALAQEHAPLTMIYDGKAWGPEQWRLYPGYE